MSYDVKELNEYQELASVTASKEPDPWKRLAILSLGVAGESSELAELSQAALLSVISMGVSKHGGAVADMLKKHLGHGHPLDKEVVKKELGDNLWYIALLAKAVGLTLNEVASANIEKLAKRYPEGFSERASLERADLKP